MADLKMRYLGSETVSEPNITVNAEYIIMFVTGVNGLTHSRCFGVLLDDNNEVYCTQSNIDNPIVWQFEGFS